MMINSVKFLLFFTVVFFLYYFPLKEKTRPQNILLLLASYFFYGIAAWKMIPLLLAATVIFYGLGILIERSNATKPRTASFATTLGVCLGIGLLLYFKYLNFFITSFSDLFSAMGLRTNWSTFNIIMPVGISFFTFKLISYLLEIFRGKIKAETDIITFAAYVSFFPTMMAGPIDRPNTFIPQLKSKRAFNYDLAADGCRQILWGLFKKMVISDSLAVTVDSVWSEIPEMPGLSLIIVAFLYPIQVYTDFSGYSDLALGVGKILGFKITKNFNYPFFGRNIAEFWRNYHMSLTSWLTDYVFMPLNIKFRNLGNLGVVFAIVINMFLVGLWHEANLTWAAFGIYNGILFIPLILSGAFAKKISLTVNKFGLPKLKDFAGMLITFVLFTAGLIIIRAPDIGQAGEYIRQMADNLFPFSFSGGAEKKRGLVMVVGLLIFEWLGYTNKTEYALQLIPIKLPRFLRWVIYFVIAFYVVIFYIINVPREFIYFQF
jgi:D-alanyl-lipoteichoic acid acyltransferase DltB (MBOAT superfamily)